MSEALLQNITKWARSRSEIRVVVLTGSRARMDGTADDLSDLDVELFSEPAEILAGSTEWLSEIGTPWVFLPLQTTDGHPARLVIFEGGAKVDFKLYPLDVLRQTVKSGRLPDLYGRGYRVLVDKDGLGALIPKPRAQPGRGKKPTQEQFRALVEEFWFEAYHVAKYLRREDLWAAKCRDWGVKELLRTMIEWHAKRTRGWSHDTWHLGIRMKDWAEPAIWGRLFSAFGRFEAQDSWRALTETMDLFSEVAKEVSDCMHYRYPDGVEDNLRSYIYSLFPTPRPQARRRR